MKVYYMVEVDETETSKTKQELVDIGLEALSEAYNKLGCYFDVGYNPQQVITGHSS